MIDRTSPGRQSANARERRCPSCAGAQITLVSHVTAAVSGMIKVEYRCAACGTAFWVVQTEVASGRSSSGS
jgi:DNA-directed RNA polymerase subunit RPC12/RpoP